MIGDKDFWRRAKLRLTWIRIKFTPQVLRAARKEHRRDANSWLWYTLFGGTLPFWAPVVLFQFFDKPLRIYNLLEHGELALFSAGLLASAIPVMRRRIKDAPVEHPEWFFRIALAMFAVIVIMLTATTLRSEFPLPGFRSQTVVRVSIGLFAVSIILGYAVELINNIRIFPNPEGIREAKEEEFESKFERRRENA